MQSQSSHRSSRRSHTTSLVASLAVLGLGACATADGGAGDDDVATADARPFADAPELPDAAVIVDASPTAPDAMPSPPDAMPAPADACVATWQDLLVNPSFDLGPGNGWTELPGFIIGTGAPVPADSGAYLSWFGGADVADDRLYQEVAVPADAQGLRLRGKILIQSDELPFGVYDALTIELRSAGGGVLLDTLLNATNLDNDVATWTPFEIAAPASRAGQTVRLWLRGTTDENTTTNFFIDSLALEVLRCP